MILKLYDSNVDHMSVSINWGPIFGVRIIRALLFGVHIRAPDFWKLPHVIESY